MANDLITTEPAKPPMEVEVKTSVMKDITAVNEEVSWWDNAVMWVGQIVQVIAVIIAALIVLAVLLLFPKREIYEVYDSVAIYMAGKEPVDASGVYKILRTELTKAISHDDYYTVIKRSDIILGTVAKMRNNLLGARLTQWLGLRLVGAHYLCIVEISKIKDDIYLLEAYFVNLDKDEVAKTQNFASTQSRLKDVDEMTRAAQWLAQELMDLKEYDETDGGNNEAIDQETKDTSTSDSTISQINSGGDNATKE